MQLQSFKAFTNAAPIQPTIIGTYNDNTVTNFPLGLVNLDGAAAAAGWFQIFDSVAAPTSTVTVPLKSIDVTAAGPIPSLLSNLGPIQINNGLWCAMSSTEAVYTAVATNFDVWGEISCHEMPLPGLSYASANDFLTVWNEASGPKTLYRVTVTNNAGAGTTRWLYIMSDNATVARVYAVIPMFTYDSKTLVAGAYNYTNVVNTSPILSFGDGTMPQALSSANVLRQGCNLTISSTGLSTVGVTLNSNNASVPGGVTVTPATDGSSIKAWYK